MTGLRLRNGRNGGWNNCGVKDFSLELSMDTSTWPSPVVEDTLASVIGVDVCELPYVSFPVIPSAAARYARFIAKNHYGDAAALDHLVFVTRYSVPFA